MVLEIHHATLTKGRYILGSLFSWKSLFGKFMIHIHVSDSLCPLCTSRGMSCDGLWKSLQQHHLPESPLVVFYAVYSSFHLFEKQRKEKLWQQFQAVDIVHCRIWCWEGSSWNQCYTKISLLGCCTSLDPLLLLQVTGKEERGDTVSSPCTQGGETSLALRTGCCGGSRGSMGMPIEERRRQGYTRYVGTLRLALVLYRFGSLRALVLLLPFC